jgi:hypothetical protein
MADTLMVLPDDTARPIIEAIAGVRRFEHEERIA